MSGYQSTSPSYSKYVNVPDDDDADVQPLPLPSSLRAYSATATSYTPSTTTAPKRPPSKSMGEIEKKYRKYKQLYFESKTEVETVTKRNKTLESEIQKLNERNAQLQNSVNLQIALNMRYSAAAAAAPATPNSPKKKRKRVSIAVARPLLEK